MERELVLERLKSTIDHLKVLKPKRFDYNDFVTNGIVRSGKSCGTVCCVAGWYPLWYGDESGLRYSNLGNNVTLNAVKKEPDYSSWLDSTFISRELVKFHGLNHYLIRLLFFGVAIENISLKVDYDYFLTIINSLGEKYSKLKIYYYSEDWFTINSYLGSNPTLIKVTLLFEFIYELIKKDLIIYN